MEGHRDGCFRRACRVTAAIPAYGLHDIAGELEHSAQGLTHTHGACRDDILPTAVRTARYTQ